MAENGKVRALVVTGGHGFEREPFFALFKGYDDITYQEVEHPKAHDLLKPEAAKSYDVIVLYDMWQKITDEARANLVNLLKQGKGVVALHHSLAGYQGWDEYANIIGGRFRLQKSVVNGVEKPASTFKHGVKFTVRIADPNHPVTRGVKDFEVVDETYGNFDVSPNVKPLLTTDEPTSGKTIGWAHTYGKSRVAYIQLGHDRAAYENPHYRRLVAQAIRWTAGQERATTQTRWRGVHIMAPRPEGLPLLKRAIAEVLAPLGINVIVFEVNYRFEFQSHPELRMEGALSKAAVRDLAELCRRHGIRLIPQFQCLGHQSWAKTTFSLLTQYPELDETPQIPKDNPDIYCRSWCPLHPKVNEIVFALMDELIDAFQADAFHVGMDEVFLIASEQCPRCRGKNPAELFAKAVNDYHQHLVKGKGLTMLMWGDRLLDDATMKYGKWEASQNATAPAIDLIPKDIVMCDWHYRLREEYPSVPYFQQKGFYVLPSSWKDAQAAVALRDCGERHATEKMLGHLCTTWGNGADFARALLGEEGASENTRQAAQALRACMGEPSKR